MKTIDIKGKAYVTVNERLIYFRANFPDYSLTTEIIELTELRAVLRAVIKNRDGVEVADGLAFELKEASFINKTSYIENCQTSAWGRALGNLGIGIETEIASGDETMNAFVIQETLSKKVSEDNINALTMMLEEYSELTGKVITLSGICKKNSITNIDDMTFEKWLEITKWFRSEIERINKESK